MRIPGRLSRPLFACLLGACLLAACLGAAGSAARAQTIPGEGRSPVGRAAITQTLPPVRVPAFPVCSGAEASFAVHGDIHRPGMAALTEGIAGALSRGACRLTVELDSDGGLLIHALSAAWFLRALPPEAEVRMVVPAGGHCHSACTILFAAGDRRAAGADATFVFHPVNVRVLNPGLQPLVPRIGKEMARYWLELVREVDKKLARRLARFQSLEAGGPTLAFRTADLPRLGKGWVEEVLPVPVPPPPPAS